jgi:hypothetical protein
MAANGRNKMRNFSVRWLDLFFIFAISSFIYAHQRWGGVGCSQGEDIPFADATPSLTLFSLHAEGQAAKAMRQHFSAR